jgi:uncharacterized OB-fold protein
MPNQYPFWKDREIGLATSEARECQRELEQLKKKLENVKCPKCGHVFTVK